MEGLEVHREYDAAANAGIEYEDAMEDIHAIKRDGTVIKGAQAPDSWGIHHSLRSWVPYSYKAFGHDVHFATFKLNLLTSALSSCGPSAGKACMF